MHAQNAFESMKRIEFVILENALVIPNIKQDPRQSTYFKEKHKFVILQNHKILCFNQRA